MSIVVFKKTCFKVQDKYAYYRYDLRFYIPIMTTDLLLDHTTPQKYVCNKSTETRPRHRGGRSRPMCVLMWAVWDTENLGVWWAHYPICEPWCWYIYLQNWVMIRANVGKYPMEHIKVWYGCGRHFNLINGFHKPIYKKHWVCRYVWHWGDVFFCNFHWNMVNWLIRLMFSRQFNLAFI